MILNDYSNYHDININEKISHDGLLLLEHSLNGFEGYDVVINNSVNSKLLVYQKYDAESTTKKVIGRIEDVELGNLLNITNQNWIVSTVPEDNKIYRKAEIQLCNSTFPIKTNKTKVLSGEYYENGTPIWNYIGGEDHSDPCIVEMGSISTDTGTQLVIPENRMYVTLRRQQSDTLVENYEFEMYGNQYKIINIDYTKVIDGKGIIKILAERKA